MEIGLPTLENKKIKRKISQLVNGRVPAVSHYVIPSHHILICNSMVSVLMREETECFGNLRNEVIESMSEKEDQESFDVCGEKESEKIQINSLKAYILGELDISAFVCISGKKLTIGR